MSYTWMLLPDIGAGYSLRYQKQLVHGVVLNVSPALQLPRSSRKDDRKSCLGGQVVELYAEVNFGGSDGNLVISIDRKAVNKSLMKRRRARKAGELRYLAACQVHQSNLRRRASDCPVRRCKHCDVVDRVVG